MPEIKRTIVALLSEAAEESLPRGEIIDIMKQGSPWKTVKRFGVQGIPNGQAQSDYQILKNKLEAIGIYLVPVGEIENFCRALGSHGSGFVKKLLSEKNLGDANLSALREFVERVHMGNLGN